MKTAQLVMFLILFVFGSVFPGQGVLAQDPAKVLTPEIYKEYRRKTLPPLETVIADPRRVIPLATETPEKDEPDPATGPRRSRFRVSVVGLTVNRETWDDALERDGKRDEVYIVAQSLVYGADGVQRSDSGVLRSRVMGDPTGRPERIAAGSTPANPGVIGIGASDAGGLRSGDRFPLPFNLRPSTFSRDALPMLLWEGELVGPSSKSGHETNVAVIVLTIWEWDSPGHDLEPAPPPAIDRDEVNFFLARTRILPSSLSLPLPQPLCPDEGCKFAHARPNSSVRLQKFNSQTLRVRDRDPWYVTLLKGGIGSNVRVSKDPSGDPRNRPIGMTDAGDHYECQPFALVLPYYVAARGGLVEVRYQDDERLKGDYVLTVLIEELS